jgi:uncharacterized protein (TIGR02145 family)
VRPVWNGGDGARGHVIVTFFPPKPTITGTFCEGEAIIASAEAPEGTTITWKWFKNNVELQGAISNTLVLELGDSGDYVVEATYNYSAISPDFFQGSIPSTKEGSNFSDPTPIVVKQLNAITLTSELFTDHQSAVIGDYITPITYVSSGATGATYDFGTLSLLSGEWDNNVITISGKVTELGLHTYTITLIGGCGSISGTIYTCPQTVTALEGEYNVAALAGRCWYRENAFATKCQDGADISPYPLAYDAPPHHPTSSEMITTFGLLYTYENVANNSDCLCPSGWSIPTSDEWNLLNYYDIKKLRNPLYWVEPNNFTNELKFDIRGAGQLNGSLNRFVSLYKNTTWWSADESDPSSEYAKCVNLNYYCGQLILSLKKKIDAMSIRCIMDK